MLCMSLNTPKATAHAWVRLENDIANIYVRPNSHIKCDQIYSYDLYELEHT